MQSTVRRDRRLVSLTARVTAQSRPGSRLIHGPGHGSVTAQSRPGSRPNPCPLCSTVQSLGPVYRAPQRHSIRCATAHLARSRATVDGPSVRPGSPAAVPRSLPTGLRPAATLLACGLRRAHRPPCIQGSISPGVEGVQAKPASLKESKPASRPAPQRRMPKLPSRRILDGGPSPSRLPGDSTAFDPVTVLRCFRMVF